MGPTEIFVSLWAAYYVTCCGAFACQLLRESLSRPASRSSRARFVELARQDLPGANAELHGLDI